MPYTDTAYNNLISFYGDEDVLKEWLSNDYVVTL